MGQSHIVQTLSNAISHDRLAHAYLFSGPRGTGKTSMARILAKSINCRQGPTLNPCQTCDLCQKISASQAVDVIEIDAASHTGVDNIRQLNDQVHFKPVECHSKLYIIDEAHMLSSGAFNALLKTVEEPPANTIFILATTEPHKIPATIHSRCQQLTFRKLTVDEISGHLANICQQESITLSATGQTVIARQSGGCMRDAVTLLDQAFSFVGTEISDEDLRRTLGIHSTESLLAFLGALVAGDTATAISTLQELFDRGLNTTQFISELLAHLNYLILAAQNIPLSETVSTEDAAQLATIASKTSVAQLTQWLTCLGQLLGDTRGSIQPELAIQVRTLEALGQSIAPVPAAPTQPATPPPPVAPKPVAASPAPAVSPPAAPTPVATPPPAAPSPTGWKPFLESVKAAKYSLYTILNNATFQGVRDGTLTISLSQGFKFFIEKLHESDSQSLLKPLMSQHFYGATKLVISNGQPAAPVATATSADSTTTAPAPSTPAPDQSLNDIINLFDGSLV